MAVLGLYSSGYKKKKYDDGRDLSSYVFSQQVEYQNSSKYWLLPEKIHRQKNRVWKKKSDWNNRLLLNQYLSFIKVNSVRLKLPLPAMNVFLKTLSRYWQYADFRGLRHAILAKVIEKDENKGFIESAMRIRSKASWYFAFKGKDGIMKEILLRICRYHHTKRETALFCTNRSVWFCPIAFDIDNYESQLVHVFALQLAPLVFVRIGELR